MEPTKGQIDKLKIEEEVTRFYKEKLKRDNFLYKSAFHTMMKTLTDAQVEIIRVSRMDK